MPVPKSRITALDWAKSQAIGQLKTIMEGLAAQCPAEWSWRIGSLTRNDPNVIVSIDDQELGFTGQYSISVNLPIARMQDEMASFAGMMTKRRDQMTALTKKHRRAS